LRSAPSPPLFDNFSSIILVSRSSAFSSSSSWPWLSDCPSKLAPFAPDPETYLLRLGVCLSGETPAKRQIKSGKESRIADIPIADRISAICFVLMPQLFATFF
jgi:hypothetical protein